MRGLSHVFSIARGSVGGITYTAGTNHQIIARQRTAPVNPNTTRQSQMRTAFAGSAALWNALSVEVRRDWELYARTVTIPNPVNPVTPTGRQMFVGNISTREYLSDRGETFAGVVNTSPALPGRLVMSNLAILDAAVSTTGFQITVTNPNPEDILVYVFKSPQQNPARMTYQGQFDTESLDSVTIVSESSGVIDYVTTGDDEVHFVKVRAIVQTGAVRTSAEQILRAVSTTTGP